MTTVVATTPVDPFRERLRKLMQENVKEKKRLLQEAQQAITRLQIEIDTIQTMLMDAQKIEDQLKAG